jgi:hypothetical protein
MRGSNSMRYLGIAGALAAAAALVIPVAASAHPTVYTDATGATRIAEGATPPFTPDELEDVTRHMITNHGFTYILVETNGQADRGMLSYARMPGAYGDSLTAEQKLDATDADTGAQPHHICRTADLDSKEAILAWQEEEGEDPFYNYIPFQKASAGLDDTPSHWIGVVQERTGVDLTQVSDDPETAKAELKTLCESAPPAGAGGTFVPADEVERGPDRLAGGVIEPLEEEITGLKASLTTAQQALATAQNAANAANARLAEVMPQLTPLSVALGTARLTARNVARSGATATVAGPPLEAVNVRLVIARSAAKKLRLGSRVLASKRVTTAANGRAQVDLKPKRRVGRALRRLRGSAAMTVEAASADRATARGTLTRR